MTSRRQFLRLLAMAGSAALIPVPLRTLAASRPPLHLIFPQDPLLTWFLPTYGAIKPDGRIHLGIDLMAPKLSPVYAISDGTVTRVAQSPRAGRHLIIDHEEGWQSWYLHLNNDGAGRDNGRADWSLTVVEGIEEGATVSAGQHIGFVGDSGNAEGAQSHTHFELHLGRRTVNPYPYLLDGQAEAMDLVHNQRVAGKVHSICYPASGRPAVDVFICPPMPEEFDPIPLGISGAV